MLSAHILRRIAPSLAAAMTTSPVVAIISARIAGKSTLAMEITARRCGVARGIGREVGLGRDQSSTYLRPLELGYLAVELPAPDAPAPIDQFTTVQRTILAHLDIPCDGENDNPNPGNHDPNGGKGARARIITGVESGHGEPDGGPAGHEHGHAPHGRQRVADLLKHLLTPHSHDAADRIDSALRTSRDGMRALWGSFAVLVVTASLQAVVVLLSGSVALLSDTLHNVADAFSAVPLAIAFTLGRRVATKAHTYGFGRAEDLAGLAVVVLITVSAVVAAVESVGRLLNPIEVRAPLVVAGAAVVGFLGNEVAAGWRMRVGRRIGSAALVADALHARADGYTSLSVLLAAAGAALGWRWVDPAVGVLVTVMIIVVLVGAGRQVFGRLLDRVDPETVDQVRALAAANPEVRAVPDVKLRWVGHGLLGELTITVDRGASLVHAHEVAHAVEHELLHGVHRLVRVHVHPHPESVPDCDDHAVVAHHEERRD